MAFSPSALSFNGSTGNVSSQPLVLTAKGGPITIKTLNFSNPVFSGTGPLPIRLQDGQSVTVTVRAKPEATASSGTLTITTSAGTPVIALSETATAAAPVSHSVSLQWSAPASSPVAIDSYKVQRAVSGSSSYSPVGTTTSGSTTFTDSAVQAGASYQYQVLAVDAAGVSSPPSNTFSVTVP